MICLGFGPLQFRLHWFFDQLQHAPLNPSLVGFL
jgi:hypothetical protein